MDKYDLDLVTLEECDGNAKMFHAFAGLALHLKTKTGGTYSRASFGSILERQRERLRRDT
jgi:hypothetical protein